MCMCMCMYIYNTCIYMHAIHTCIHTYIHTYIHKCRYAYTSMYDYKVVICMKLLAYACNMNMCEKCKHATCTIYHTSTLTQTQTETGRHRQTNP